MNKEILRLAIPNILSNISVPLISTVDTVLMGHLSTVHLGAVGLGAMIFNFVYWNFGFLRMGTTGITAQAFGENSDTKILDTLLRSCITAGVITLIIVAFSIPIFRATSWAMNVSPESMALVKQYFFIRLCAAPATLLIYSLNGWYFGMQDAVSPLRITLIVNLTNAVISVVLVRYFDWELAGVAWGTVIAQYLGLLTAIWIMYNKYRSTFAFFDKVRLWNKDAFLRFLHINRDIFIRTLFLSSAFFFLYSQSSKEGAMFLAVNTILIQLIHWMSYGVDGFAFAAESMVGKYVGAKNETKVNQTIRYTMIWGFGLALLYSLTFGLFFDSIIIWFNSEAELLALSKQFFPFVVAMPLVAFACYIWDGIYIGLTASKAMRNSMGLAFILYLSLFYFGEGVFGSYTIWVALFGFLLFRGIFQSILYKRKGWSLE